ncbi:glycosyl hydrolase family 28-related protein [Paenibacillus oleatilyticus]|uniref:Glycosyl hydrolase family 28-related protein n=1 Tax=Paenibacillus oleatilyticus TaxID=2594886 RepID=A0ABV4V8Y1_9BACL|nr:glycosyl hydrolase family 28-related protein [Paenibacillus oleatilyticus]MBU7320058.1 hypothetical protein [Paenibacillus oleatilyticus]
MGDLTTMIVNARDYGAIPIEENANYDSTNALNAAFAAAIRKKLPCYVPPGTYQTSGPLVAKGSNVMIYGAGGTNTVIKTLSTDYDCILIGPGANMNNQSLGGFLRDIYFLGPVKQPQGVTAGVKLNGIRQFEVRNVQSDGFPIAFDLINNCFGSVFFNLRAQYNWNTVALNLRSGFQSGNDLQFYNCWLGGTKAAVHISPASGGFHFWGGQLSAGFGLNAPDDNLGIVVIGKDLVTGAIGGTANIIFDGIDFEGYKHVWALRAFDKTNMAVRGCSFLANSGTDALGILKQQRAQSSQFTFENNTVRGPHSGPPIVIEGEYSAFSIYELGTEMNRASFLNYPSLDTGLTMLEVSQIKLGTGIGRSNYASKIVLGNVLLRSLNNQLQISTDWGKTWKVVQTL